MKKLCTVFLVFALIFSLSSTAFAAGKSGKDNGKSSGSSGSSTSTVTSASPSQSTNLSESTSTTTEDESVTEGEDSDIQTQKNQTLQKKFKDELNETKKQLQSEKSDLNKERASLQTQYETLVASGDTAGAAAILEKIKALDTEVSQLQSQIKQAINERYMLVKTMYSAEELAQFESASAVIEQMYKDAATLEAGSITVNNNLIKFDAPAYLKGSVTLVPIRAISEELGAEVTWDQTTGTVKIVKDDKIIEMTPNSSTILVNGAPVEMATSTEVTCGRTYLPLRVLAEALGFDVTWDGENQQISIDDQTGEATSTETSQPPSTDISQTSSADTSQTSSTNTSESSSTVNPITQ